MSLIYSRNGLSRAHFGVAGPRRDEFAVRFFVRAVRTRTAPGAETHSDIVLGRRVHGLQKHHVRAVAVVLCQLRHAVHLDGRLGEAPSSP